jgi:hypothetical protein
VSATAAPVPGNPAALIPRLAGDVSTPAATDAADETLLDLASASHHSGALELMTEGSTKPVTSTVTYAGIVTVDRFEAIAPTN